MPSILFSPLLFAGKVNVELKFDKRPPTAGIFYAMGSKPTAKNGVLDQKNKEFTSSIVVTDNEGSLTFKNTDDVDHNIFANDRSSGVEFDVGLMPTGTTNKLDVDWKKDTLVRLGCKIHPRMRAYIANINSDSYKVFEFDRDKTEYAAEIDNVDDSTSQFRFMFGNFDPVEVEVKKGESKTIPLTKRGKEAGSAKISR